MSAALEAVSCCAPLGAEVLSDGEAGATAELFKALGDPARVRIVNVVARSEEPVWDRPASSTSLWDSRSRPSPTI